MKYYLPSFWRCPLYSNWLDDRAMIIKNYQLRINNWIGLKYLYKIPENWVFYKD